MRKQTMVELNELKGALRTRKITYRELAARIGRSVTWISDMLNGYAIPDLLDMMVLCDCAGIPRDQIEALFICPNISKQNKTGESKKQVVQKGA